jgi:hypothetical protein
MKIAHALFPTLALLLSSFSHAQQVGIVKNGIYYSLNPRLPNGTLVQVLTDDDKGLIRCCGEIAGPAKRPDDEVQVLDSLHDRSVMAYTLTLSGSLLPETSGFGIAGYVHMVRQGQRPQAVLDDGLQLNLSICTSAEGWHYLGRRVGDNKLLVHLYKYFDGDLEPTCRRGELE